ncbi:hypothetical protein DRO53_02830 [Candidatus Bathyarchaeota archaeon]|nr:MAG: hypothetical protein DRO53_02830 [Candidatus Bathyarchaeota archaeon]
MRRMADLLRSGATMLEEACPQCNSPLFKLTTGEIYCAKCGRKVIIVRSDEEIPSAVTPVALSTLEETLTVNLQRLEKQIRKTEDAEVLEQLLRLVNAHLEALEKVRRLRRS